MGLYHKELTIRTEKEVAEIMGWHQPGVHRHEESAMRKLRELFAGEDLSDYELPRTYRSGRWNGKRLIVVR